MKYCKKSSGFTLIEILITLGIVSIALIGLVKSQTQGVKNLTYFKQKTVANLVASNLATENRLLKKIELGHASGTYDLAKNTWYWRTHTTAKIVPNTGKTVFAKKMILSVYLDKAKYDDNKAISTLELILQVTFLEKKDEY